MKKREISIDYPRPQFVRKEWENLNGIWQFAFDDGDIGQKEKWFEREFSGEIEVPFCYQSARSGIGDPSYHPVVWYKRSFVKKLAWKNQRILLHFEAVDYEFDLWVNRIHAGRHRGGNTAVVFDISRWMQEGENELCLRVCDRLEREKPQGKQAPVLKIDRCWYTQTTGIWKTVWLEPVPKTYLSHFRTIPDLDHRMVKVEAELDGEITGARLKIDLFYQGEAVVCDTADVLEDRICKAIPITLMDYVDELHYWTPETPNLYDLFLTLELPDGSRDEVQTYFGMRKIEARDGRIYLNHRPYDLRMVLDQGYWKESLMTPPENTSLKEDVILTKQMGFNGARKHQKIEDDRYYYWADQLGLLVWAEMPSAYCFCEEEVKRITGEWMECVTALYNHPSIAAWVPLNESWGVRDILNNRQQQDFAVSLYHLTRSLDSTRLVSTNDGWEQVTSDICGIHDYYASEEEFQSKYADMEHVLETQVQGRNLYARGFAYQGQPILMTEYGGIAFGKGSKGAWGYNEDAGDEEELLRRIREVTLPILEEKRFCGFCYTQLTDVMQEINGLADETHRPKVDPEKLREIFAKKR